MRCASPIAAVIVGDAEFYGWLPPSEPFWMLSLSDGVCFLPAENNQIEKKKNKGGEIWKLKIIKKTKKTMDPETENEQWQAEES